MVYVKPTLTIPDAEIDGSTVTGEFVFPTNVRYELGTETSDLFQSSGTASVVSQLVLEYIETNNVDLGDGFRKELSFDAGAGQHIVTLDFSGYTGSNHRWGATGNGGDPTDATGEDLHAQMCVLDRYLQKATIDSENPAILEISEYSSAGRYAPLKVVPRNPQVVFDSVEESSVFTGSMTFVETVDIRNYSSGTQQSPE